MNAPSLTLAKRPEVVIRLREATRTHHRALDHHAELQRLMRPGFTTAGYARSLAAMLAPHATLERAVWQGAQALGLEHTLSPRRQPSLTADLELLAESLGLPAGHVALACPEPSVAASLLPRCPSQLLGLRYVLEGSRLGGDLLARQVCAALGDDVPVSFLADAEASLHWQSFCSRAGRDMLGAEPLQRAIAAARAAFDGYRMQLDRFHSTEADIQDSLY